MTTSTQPSPLHTRGTPPRGAWLTVGTTLLLATAAWASPAWASATSAASVQGTSAPNIGAHAALLAHDQDTAGSRAMPMALTAPIGRSLPTTASSAGGNGDGGDSDIPGADPNLSKANPLAGEHPTASSAIGATPSGTAIGSAAAANATKGQPAPGPTLPATGVKSHEPTTGAGGHGPDANSTQDKTKMRILDTVTSFLRHLLHDMIGHPD